MRSTFLQPPFLLSEACGFHPVSRAQFLNRKREVLVHRPFGERTKARLPMPVVAGAALGFLRAHALVRAVLPVGGKTICRICS